MTVISENTRTRAIEIPSDIDLEIRAMAHRTGDTISDIVVAFIREGMITCNRRGTVSYGDRMASLEALRIEDEGAAS